MGVGSGQPCLLWLGQWPQAVKNKRSRVGGDLSLFGRLQFREKKQDKKGQQPYVKVLTVGEGEGWKACRKKERVEVELFGMEAWY